MSQQAAASDGWVREHAGSIPTGVGIIVASRAFRTLSNSGWYPTGADGVIENSFDLGISWELAYQRAMSHPRASEAQVVTNVLATWGCGQRA